MKNKSAILALFLALLVGLTGCKPEEYVLEDAPSKLDGINDTFVLTRVLQVDQQTLNLENTRDISNFFIGETPARITFDSNTGTFTIDPGTTIDFLGTAGTWAFDDDEFPSMITMNNGTETYTLELLQTIRPQDELQVQLDRNCSGELTTSYQYYFTRN